MINLKTTINCKIPTVPAIQELYGLETNTTHTTMGHVNSLAYLSYKNRKEKGLINDENNEQPKIFFGDEWVF